MEQETTWIDAWIRWDRGSKDIIADEEEEEEDRVPPTAEFSFEYRFPTTTKDVNTNTINLTLKGFPSESEQIWNSTGLTLWPSSHYLCQYLVDHHNHLLLSSDNRTMIRAVELGSGLGRCGLLLHRVLAARFAVEPAKESSPCDPESSILPDTIISSSSSHLYLTDGDTDTLAQLRDNVRDNTAQTPKHDSTNNGNDNSRESTQETTPNHSVSCHQLLWGETFAREFCEHHFVGSASATTTTETYGVALVFGSDLIYAPRAIVPLFETVRTLLSWKVDNITTPVFLMAHSDRREGSSVTLKMVLQGANDAGLDYDILQEIEREGIYIIAFRVP